MFDLEFGIIGPRRSGLLSNDLNDECNLNLKERMKSKLLENMLKLNVKNAKVHLCGSLGVDSMAFEICKEIEKENNISFYKVVVAPYEELYKDCFTGTEEKYYRSILEQVDEIVYVDELEDYVNKSDDTEVGKHSLYKIFERNTYLINNVKYLFSVWNGEVGGTSDCIRKALDAELPVTIIPVEDKEDIGEYNLNKLFNRGISIYTSYFANVNKIPPNIVPISISRWSPKWLSWVLSFKDLAPSKEIVTECKSVGMDSNEYTVRYTSEVLNNLDAKDILYRLSSLSNGKDIALLCYERPGDMCHRHLVAKWLEQDLGITVKELPND